MTETVKAEKNGHVYWWITDRQPTEADANGAGAVRIRKYPNGSSSAAVHWQYIGPGVPWQHCHDWTEKEEVHFQDYVDDGGNLWRRSLSEDVWSLVSAGDAPPVENSEVVLPVDHETLPTVAPRPFLSISRSFGPHGEHYLDAVATDCTAWFRQLDRVGAQWQQHQVLPDIDYTSEVA